MSKLDPAPYREAEPSVMVGPRPRYSLPRKGYTFDPRPEYEQDENAYLTGEIA